MESDLELTFLIYSLVFLKIIYILQNTEGVYHMVKNTEMYSYEQLYLTPLPFLKDFEATCNHKSFFYSLISWYLSNCLYRLCGSETTKAVINL